MVAIASAPVCFKPTLGMARPSSSRKVVVRAVSDNKIAQDALVKSATIATVASSFLAAGNAQAAMEIANVAAGDGRSGLLFLPLAAALGWVGFNILGPAQNQIANMADKKKGLIAGLGLGAASLLAAQGADAAEIAELAAGDGRSGLLFLPLAAALGWVGFNILGPAQNQIANMADKKKAFVGAGLGLATLLAAQGADAAEIAELAAGDSRSGLLFLPLLAALGWVGFNILGPAQNQLKNMSEKKKAFVGAGLGLATLLAAQGADAAEIAELAAGDGRSGLLFLPLVAALGWVGFNILGPAQNQIANMAEKKKAVIGAGMGMATLLAAQNADAATEAMQLAAGDGRSGLLFLPLVAALGWVGFNILGPAQNQIANMAEKRK